MIIDVHAHYTQASPKLDAYRGRQVGSQNKPARGSLGISDEEIVESLAGNMRQMKDRGIDRLMFSPRAGGMGHDFGNELISRYWTEVNNDLIGRVCKLFPKQFSPVGQLPQTPGVSPKNCPEEIDRCVKEWGFVAFNINPDVSGGAAPFTPSLGSEWWYPLWEKMTELDVPGMIHASSTLNPGLHVNGSHYVNWDTAAVVELCNSRVFDDFPKLKLIIPHGGGAIPFQWRRHSALHELARKRPFEEMVKHLWFDMAIYDQDFDGAACAADGRRQSAVRERDVRHREGHGPSDRAMLRRHGAVCEGDPVSVGGGSVQDIRGECSEALFAREVLIPDRPSERRYPSCQRKLVSSRFMDSCLRRNDGCGVNTSAVWAARGSSSPDGHRPCRWPA